jgi:hypothetical protein
MLRLFLVTGLLLGCVCPDAAAQDVHEVIVMEKGRPQILPFKGLAGASVGNVNVIFIQDRRPDRVVIFGSGVGETYLEILYRDERRKRLTVRVLAAPKAGTHTPVLPAPPAREPVRGQNAAISPPGRLGGTTAPDVSGGQGADAAAVAPPASSPPGRDVRAQGPATTTARETNRPRGRRNRARLEVTAETVILSDKEQVRVMSPELMEPGKLQKAISAATAERLADSPKREQTITVRRSSVITLLSAQYDVSGRNTLTFVVPFVQRSDEIEAGATSVKTRSRGLGDLQVKFEREYARLRETAWDGTVELNFSLPTGRSVYNAGENQLPLGIGHYEIGTMLGASRVFDPLAFSAAAGVTYTLPRTVEGIRIAPGLGFQAQTGVAYAVTDKIGITQSLQYTRSPNAFLSTPTDARTVSVEQTYLRHSLILNPRGGHVLRMMFSMGVNPESLNRGFGITYSFRRPNKPPE